MPRPERPEVRAGILVSVLRRFNPMLAGNRPARIPAAVWAFEPKLDGWRALAYIDGRLTVRTRNGRDVTDHLPDLAGLADNIGRRCVIDGELVAGTGLQQDFYRVAPLVARRPDRSRRALTFVAFDILWLDDQPTVRQPYRARRKLLEGLRLSGEAWATVPAFTDTVAAVMDACTALGLEGMVQTCRQPLPVGCPLRRLAETQDRRMDDGPRAETDRRRSVSGTLTSTPVRPWSCALGRANQV
jgi:ATP-dependent DNA ligase